MKRSIVVMCLTILTAALLLASTAIAFATDVPATPPTLVYNEQTPAPMPELEVKVPETEAITEVLETEVETEVHEPNAETETKLELTFNSKPGAIAPSTTAPLVPVHRHTIVAYDYAHWCECGEYVPHDTEHMLQWNTPYFAVYSCEECGYTFSERHSFVVCHDGIDGHYKVCLHCGYITEYVPHNYVDSFSGTYHNVICTECGYVDAEHYGVNFDPVSGNTHVATCERCGMNVEESHAWDGFTCHRCDYVVRTNMIVGVATDIYEVGSDVYMDVLVESNLHEWVKVPVRSYGAFDEGDLVLISQHENTVHDVCTFVDGKVVEAPENFYDYFPDSSSFDFPEGLTLEDVTIGDVAEFDTYVCLVFEELEVRFAHSTVTYNMVTMETMDITDLEAGDQVIWFNGLNNWFVLVIG